MASSIASMLLMLSVSASGGLFQGLFQPGGRIMNDGPGPGWGFRNGNPDGYGWVDPYSQEASPLGRQPDARLLLPPLPRRAGRPDVLPDVLQPVPDPRPAVRPLHQLRRRPPRGPPAGRPRPNMPIHPYNDTLGTQVLRPQPAFNGRVEAPPINPGTSGLRP